MFARRLPSSQVILQFCKNGLQSGLAVEPKAVAVEEVSRTLLAPLSSSHSIQDSNLISSNVYATNLLPKRTFVIPKEALLIRTFASKGGKKVRKTLGEAIQERMGAFVERHTQLCEGLNDSGSLGREELSALHRELAALEAPVQTWSSLQAIRKEIAEVEEMQSDAGGDQELRKMAEDELAQLTQRYVEVERVLALLLMPRDEAEDVPAVLLEVRAGAGGDEASIFAMELFKMYERFASLNGWRSEVVTVSQSDHKGYKEATLSITGDEVYKRLKYESGVHRVQRVPLTESQGRIHTSTASVAIMPQPDEVQVVIRNEDLKVDTYRSQGAGGQSVNTTDSAVRVTHIPTGVVVAMQDERSQHKNKEKALKILRARIYDAERLKAQREQAATRKTLIGTADRSEKIRTYNFPQDRVSDHRVKLTIGGIDVFMQGGKLDELIDSLKESEDAQAIEDLCDES